MKKILKLYLRLLDKYPKINIEYHYYEDVNIHQYVISIKDGNKENIFIKTGEGKYHKAGVLISIMSDLYLYYKND